MRTDTPMLPEILDIQTLTDGYRDGLFTPVDVVGAVLDRVAAWPDPAVWIALRGREELLAEAMALTTGGFDPARPLWGIPFAIKDNIDLAGVPTTAACPAFTFLPEGDATVVARLKAAGAIAIGKTNLDQFATGLNGTRSPFGAPRSVFNADYVSGGSSSGSAVAVASGMVPFSLGTDTAGSGRVPAAFNNLVGVKPTVGLLSNTGLLPACRSIDCISIFAVTADDATRVRKVAEGFDASDPFSVAGAQQALPDGRLRIGVPAPAGLEFLGDTEAEKLYRAAVERLAGLGHDIVEIDYGPFRAIADFLYAGPWVAERLAGIEAFHAAHAADMDPAVEKIVAGAKAMSATDVWRGLYRFKALKRATEAEWGKMDVLLLPTAPTTYTVAEMLADPIRKNSDFGIYTNFVNLCDLAAIAVPAGFRPNGLPFGVTLIAPAFHDDALATLADPLHRAGGWGPGRARTGTLPQPAALSGAATAPGGSGPAACGGDRIAIAVVGAHLAGQPLNGELVGFGATFVRATRTASDYRLYALSGTVLPKPGLIRDPGFDGPGIEVEIWTLPADGFGRFVAAIPAPLGIGKLTLQDGSEVSGFLGEGHAIAGAREITAFGGWRAFRAVAEASRSA